MISISSIRDVVIPPLNDGETFERFCLDYWKKRLNDPSTQRNAVRGQSQDGVDIFGRNEAMEWVGVQCKVREGKLTKGECMQEITKALHFNPRLSEYYIMTTASRDQKLQEHIRCIDDEHIKQNNFRVFIIFWNDLCEEMVEQEYQFLYFKYFRDHCIRSEYFGNGVSKLMSIEIGVGSKVDSRYEILLGILPKRKRDDSNIFGINHWKDTYYIANMNNNKCAVFKLPCHESDLKETFNRRDRFIITEWINHISTKLDNVVYGIEESDSFLISDDKYLEFLELFRE